MKQLLLLTLLGWLVVSLKAQTCLETAIQKGQAAYDQGQYAKARDYWQTGKECPSTNVQKLNDLIWKTKDADSDGVVNGRDKCPNTYGTLPNGCPKPPVKKKPKPPSDRDGVADAADDGYWEALKDGDTADCDKYLRKYPNGRHASEARRRKESLAPKPDKTTAVPEGFAFVKGGNFTMGDLFGEGESGETQHSVTVSDFYLGKYEVTVAQFKAFADATGHQTDAEKGDGSYIWNSTEWKKTAGINWRHDVAGKLRPASEHDHPVIHVSWNDATAYCEWLSKKTGKKYRLPTEAEWEFAAREGGKKIRFGNGKDIANPAQINFVGSEAYKKDYSVAGEYRQKTVAVGSLRSPNALGLHDMSGNVWEWCSDWYGAYPAAAQVNPSGPTEGANRVLRGGSWYDDPQYCRAADRDSSVPPHRSGNIGFRVALAASFQ